MHDPTEFFSILSPSNSLLLGLIHCFRFEIKRKVKAFMENAENTLAMTMVRSWIGLFNLNYMTLENDIHTGGHIVSSSTIN